MKKMDPVVHFEMPAKDKERVNKFYSEVFGWQMQQLGPEMGNYILAGTVETKDMIPTRTGAINGGFFDWEDKEGFNAPHVVIEVEDLDGSIEKAKKAGGTVMSPKMDIQGVGMYVSLKDSEGNIIGILQPPKSK